MTAAGGKIESDWKLDGVDLVPYLTGRNAGQPHQSLFWRYGEQWAVRHGNHKLVVAEGGTEKPQLYDLANDIGEKKDLASQDPQKVKELQKLYDAWNKEQAPPNAPIDPKVTKGKKAAADAETD